MLVFVCWYFQEYGFLWGFDLGGFFIQKGECYCFLCVLKGYCLVGGVGLLYSGFCGGMCIGGYIFVGVGGVGVCQSL